MGEIPLSELARRCATEFSTKELCRLTDAQHQEYLGANHGRARKAGELENFKARVRMEMEGKKDG